MQKRKEVRIAHGAAQSTMKRIFIFKFFDGVFPHESNVSKIKPDELMSKLKAFEDLSLTELRNQKSHSIPVVQMTKEAQKRLSSIKQAEYYDELFSFRLNGKGRLFTFTSEEYELVLWLDSEHKICPSLKRNT